MAVFENRCIILVKILVVTSCLKRTRVPANYTKNLCTYIKFIIAIWFLFCFCWTRIKYNKKQ